MTEDQALKPISSKFIRDEFQWDRMEDVKLDILRSNLEACNRILANPEKFPKADFDYIEIKSFEITLFLNENGYLVS